MTLAISWGVDDSQDSGFIVFDCTSSYSRSRKGQVTKHPISLGSSITDHYLADNQSITLSAVISGSDLSSSTFLIQDLKGNAAFNSFSPTTEVNVNSTDQSVLKKFIPDSIGQFLSDSAPTITMDTARDDLLEQVRESLENLTSGKKYNDKTGQFDPNIQLVQLYEYDGTILRKVINNLVVTNLVFREDANTGYALYFDMTLEQVTFAFLKKATIPKDITNSLKKKAAKKDTKGKVDSTPDAGTPPKDTDPLRQAKENG